MAIVTVGTAGADYTTVAAATTAAGPTDTIQLITDITETWFQGAGQLVAAIQSDSTRRTWTAGAGQSALNTVDGVTSLDIDNIKFISTTSSSSIAHLVSLNYSASIVKINVRDCIFQSVSTWTPSGGGSNALVFCETDEANPGPPFTVVDRCEFIGTGGNLGHNIGFWNLGSFNSPPSSEVRNCIFRDLVASDSGSQNRGAISSLDADVLGASLVYNCTFYNNVIAAYGDHDMDVHNCLFIGNTDDVLFGSSGKFTKSNFLNCAFGEQTNDGGWDASIVFGVVTNDEVNNAAGSDFSLRSIAQSRNAGITISSVTADFTGTARPQESVYDIGAYEFVVSPPPPLVLGGIFLIKQ